MKLEKSPIIKLDLNVIKLFGWERQVYDKLLESIIKGIEQNAKFPPIYIERVGENYWLDGRARFDIKPDIPGYHKLADGGHHRAVAHYILNVPIRCILTRAREIRSSDFPERTWVGDIKIIEDRRGEYTFKRGIFPNYI